MTKTKYFFWSVGLAVISIVALSLINLLSAPPPLRPSAPSVAATIYPLYDVTRHVAGDDIGVVLLLPPGSSPHTFEPSPSILKNLRGAVALYAVGQGLDDWASDLTAGTGTEIVIVDQNIALRHAEEPANEEEAEEDEHGHGGIDPHYWLSVTNAKIIAATVAADLSARFPEKAEIFNANLAAYLTELDAADAQIRATLSPVEKREIVTLHDAWYYFAEEYGLEVAASFEPSPGREPTPQYLAALGHAVTTTGVNTIYSEPQLSTAALLPFAQDHQLNIVVLDPLGGVPNRDTFIAMMLYNAQTIAQNQ